MFNISIVLIVSCCPAFRQNNPTARAQPLRVGGSGPPKSGRTTPTFYVAAGCSAQNWVYHPYFALYNNLDQGIGPQFSKHGCAPVQQNNPPVWISAVQWLVIWFSVYEEQINALQLHVNHQYCFIVFIFYINNDKTNSIKHIIILQNIHFIFLQFSPWCLKCWKHCCMHKPNPEKSKRMELLFVSRSSTSIILQHITYKCALLTPHDHAEPMLCIFVNTADLLMEEGFISGLDRDGLASINCLDLHKFFIIFEDSTEP